MNETIGTSSAQGNIGIDTGINAGSSSSKDDVFDRKLFLFSKDLAGLQKNIADMKAEIEHGLKNVKDDLSEANKKIESSKVNSIETVGILIGLFTFISIEFQIFRSEFALQEAAGLSLIIFGCMIFFVSAIDFFIKLDIPLFEKRVILPKSGRVKLATNVQNSFAGEEKNVPNWKGVIIRVGFLLIGILSIAVGVFLFSSDNKKMKDNSDKQKVEINNHGSIVEIEGNKLDMTKEGAIGNVQRKK